MPMPFLLETFDTQLDARLNWFCAPEIWTFENGNLVFCPDAKTDFWQRTHYSITAQDLRNTRKC